MGVVAGAAYFIAMHAVAQLVERAPDIVDFKTEDDICSAYQGSGALAVVEVMVSWKIQPALLINNRRL